MKHFYFFAVVLIQVQAAYGQPFRSTDNQDVSEACRIATTRAQEFFKIAQELNQEYYRCVHRAVARGISDSDAHDVNRYCVEEFKKYNAAYQNGIRLRMEAG